jgi:hypothetical protein
MNYIGINSRVHFMMLCTPAKLSSRRQWWDQDSKYQDQHIEAQDQDQDSEARDQDQKTNTVSVKTKTVT